MNGGTYGLPLFTRLFCNHVLQIIWRNLDSIHDSIASSLLKKTPIPYPNRPFSTFVPGAGFHPTSICDTTHLSLSSSPIHSSSSAFYLHIMLSINLYRHRYRFH
ncbi:hypothetical protein Hanom_Chr09g00820351 [Helianthus anomalus]